MDFKELTRKVPADGDFADVAWNLAQTFSCENPNVDDLRDFLVRHSKMEENNATVFEEFAPIAYHPNVAKAAKARAEVYRLILDRLQNLS